MKNPWIIVSAVLGAGLFLDLGILLGQNTSSNKLATEIVPTPVVTVIVTKTPTPVATPTPSPTPSKTESTVTQIPKAKKKSNNIVEMCNAFYSASSEMNESVTGTNAGGPGGAEKTFNELKLATDSLAGSLDSTTGAAYIDMKDYVFLLRQLAPSLYPTVTSAANDILAKARNQSAKIFAATYCG
jgi:hypothetical protein